MPHAGDGSILSLLLYPKIILIYINDIFTVYKRASYYIKLTYFNKKQQIFNFICYLTTEQAFINQTL